MCKENHKTWEKTCPHKKVEIECIAKALAQRPYRYPIREKEQRAKGDLSYDDAIAEVEIDTEEPAEESPRLLAGKKLVSSKITKFLAADSPLLPNLSQSRALDPSLVFLQEKTKPTLFLRRRTLSHLDQVVEKNLAKVRQLEHF